MNDAASDRPGELLFDAAFLAALERLRFAVRRLQAREGDGRVDRSRRGGLVEFADHRRYVMGDDPRAVDWAVYQRTGRLYVKEYEREDELALLLLVDDSASMGCGRAFRAAARLAYALAYLGLVSGSRVRLGLCGGARLRLGPEVAGVARIRSLVQPLRDAAPHGATDLDQVLSALPPGRRGSRVVVLLSDLLAENDGCAAAVRLASAGDDVNVLRIEDRDAGPSPSRRDPTVLVDAETGERLLVEGDAERVARHALAALDERWHQTARRHRLRYLTLNARAPVEELALTWLRAGGVLA